LHALWLNALLASQKIWTRRALLLIMEWKLADFGSLGGLEVCLLLGVTAVSRHRCRRCASCCCSDCTWRCAGARCRNSGAARRWSSPRPGRQTAAPRPPARLRGCCSRASGRAAGGNFGLSVHRFAPHIAVAGAAVAALKQLNLFRVFNDYDFGGYLTPTASPFHRRPHRTYGEKFFVDQCGEGL
jgi:hypothetical protein